MRLPAKAGLTVLLAVLSHGLVRAENDDLMCFQVRDPLRLAAVVDLGPAQLGAQAGCKVGKATYYCVPAADTVRAATDEKAHRAITPLAIAGRDPGNRICYKLKCPRAVIPDVPDADEFGSRTFRKLRTSFVCAPTMSARFTDHGDGTVTDNATGLQWEKKTTSVGSGANYDDPHDVDNLYSWGLNDEGSVPPDGTAFTEFVGALNETPYRCASDDGVTMSGGFAGHCDWRLPTITELRTILVTQYPCTTPPCIDPIFGPTVADPYWSSTDMRSHPSYAWFVFFGNGAVSTDGKSLLHPVRAVRGGR